MPDGSKWDVPAVVVAERRATYYADKETDPVKSMTVFQEERESALHNADELVDWAKNNMNWTDVKKHATMYGSSKEVDYQEGWCNGEMEAVL